MKILSRLNQTAVLFKSDHPTMLDTVNDAVLKGASLIGANLHDASLIGANLHGADLSEANLSWANLSGAIGLYQIVPEVGSFEGFKKLSNGVVCHLRIPDDAGRVGGLTGRKCRASHALVLSGEGASQYDSNFKYKVGKIVIPDKWDDDRRVDCSSGIHFFLTLREAEEWPQV